MPLHRHGLRHIGVVPLTQSVHVFQTGWAWVTSYLHSYKTEGKDYKYLSWVDGVDRKISHEGH